MYSLVFVLFILVSSIWAQPQSPNPRLFVGGRFTTIRSPPSSPANGVAIWDDESDVWSGLPTGLNLRTQYANISIDPYFSNEITSAFWDNTQQALFIGGNFNQIGGVMTSSIVKYSNQTWFSLSTTCDGYVNFITRAGNLGIAVGGNFTKMNQVKSCLVLLDDSGTWQSLGDISGSIEAMVVYNEQLYVGGNFTVAGISSNGFAVYNLNSKNWTSYGQVCGGIVTQLAVLDNLLYVAGTFTSYTNTKCPGILGEKIAEFNLTTNSFTKNIQLTNETINGDITAIVAGNGQLVVCGYFTILESLTGVDRFAVYTPNSGWSNFGGKNFGIPFSGNPPYVALSANSNFYFGGYFLGYYGVACYRSDLSIWSNLGNGVSCTICPYVIFGYTNVPTVFALAILPPGESEIVPEVPSSDSVPGYIIGSQGQWEEYGIPPFPGSSVLYNNGTDYSTSLIGDSRPKIFYWQTWSVIGVAIFVGSLLLATLLNICVKSVRRF